MFSGSHVILFSRSPEADRAFLRDRLALPHVDAGDGWLIFKLPPAEVAVHPTDTEPRHELFLMCADLAATLARLRADGVPIPGPIRELSWGRLATITLPSGTSLGLYEPRHPAAHDL